MVRDKLFLHGKNNVWGRVTRDRGQQNLMCLSMELTAVQINVSVWLW